MKKIIIYALICPEENLVKYVGKTSDLNRRFKEHLDRALKRPDKNNKNKWIEELRIKQKSPRIEILETATELDWKEKEIYWISYYSKINTIFNKTIGGEDGIFEKSHTPWNKGGAEYSEESRLKMRNSKLGTTLKDEHKSNISKTLLGKPKSETHKLNIRKGQSKPVIQMDLEGNFIKEYLGASFAVEENPILDAETIKDCCRGKSKTHRGFKWCYKS